MRVSHALASVDYRAYAEPLLSGSVLDWIVARFAAALPEGGTLACVCDFPSERRRLEMAYHGQDTVEFVSGGADGSEVQQYLRLAIERGHTRLIVAGLGHAVAPSSFLRELLHLHRAMCAELTDASDAVFAAPLYIVEASLLDTIAGTRLSNVPDAVIPAAQLLQAAHAHDPTRTRHFLSLTIDLQKRYGIDASRWPETIDFRTSRDVAILRQALDGPGQESSGHSLIDALKRASIADHQRYRASRPAARRRRTASRSSRRIRVLYGSSTAAFTGAQQSLCHLIGALDRSVIEPLALVPYRGTFTAELQRRGARVICPSRDFIAASAENIDFVQGLLDEYNPDIVHSNHNIGYPLAYEALSRGIPLVQHVRVQWPRGLRELIHAADAVIAVSHFVRQRVLALDVDPDRVHVIWNGVDLRDFLHYDTPKPELRKRLGIPPDEFVVSMIARLAPNKRHDIAIDAVADLRCRIGKGHLVLVGDYDGDKACATRVAAQLAARGLTAHVTTISFLPDIRPVLFASDVTLLPSEDEPLARSVLEGMAAALPVVIANSGGTPEVISPGRTGMLVPCGNVNATTDALIRLVREPVLAERIGAAAREMARASLTASQCAERTTQIYERLITAQHIHLQVPRKTFDGSSYTERTEPATDANRTVAHNGDDNGLGSV